MSTAVNVAVTAWSAFNVTEHVPVAMQSPLHPANVDPTSGAAVRSTGVPSANDAEQVVPQSIPAGELVTVPVPLPSVVTARVCVPVAATVIGAVSPVGATVNPSATALALLR